MRTDDRPRAALAEITNAVTYAVHPYRRPIIGWPEDVRRMTLSDLRNSTGPTTRPTTPSSWWPGISTARRS